MLTPPPPIKTLCFFAPKFACLRHLLYLNTDLLRYPVLSLTLAQVDCQHFNCGETEACHLFTQGVLLVTLVASQSDTFLTCPEVTGWGPHITDLQIGGWGNATDMLLRLGQLRWLIALFQVAFSDTVMFDWPLETPSLYRGAFILHEVQFNMAE